MEVLQRIGRGGIIPAFYSVLMIGSRVIPHLPNVTPLTAISFMSGSKYGFVSTLWLFLPSLLISDYLIGFYDWRVMLGVYGAYAAIIGIGVVLKPTQSFNRLVLTTLISATVFFVLTNLSVWLFSPMYTKDLQGLLHCFVMAIPFFRNSLLGDLVYGSLLFSLNNVTVSNPHRIPNLANGARVA